MDAIILFLLLLLLLTRPAYYFIVIWVLLLLLLAGRIDRATACFLTVLGHAFSASEVGGLHVLAGWQGTLVPTPGSDNAHQASITAAISALTEQVNTLAVAVR